MFTPNSNGHLNLNVEFQPHNEFNRTRTSAIKGRKKASSFNFSIGPPGSTRGSGGSRGWPGCQSGGLAERPGIPGASSTSSTKNGPVVSGVLCEDIILTILFVINCYILVYY